MRETASSFVTSLERQLATVAAAGMNFTTVQPHVGVMTLSVSSDSLENGLVYVAFSDGDSVKENFEPNNVKTFFENIFPIDMVGASIALPPEIVSISQAQTGEDEIRVYFTVYQNSSLFISNKLSKESRQDFTRQVGSHVISASVEAVKIDGLVYPVKAAFLPRFETINNTECVFWDFSVDDGVGDWSSDGCVYNKTEDDRVICFCDHLTNFAILVDYYEPKDSPFQDVLTIISLIGCIVSIVCLAITIATYLYFKQFRSKRPQRILINLSFSLLLLYLVFAIGIEKTSSRNGCIAVAALIHYFGLASVFWMSIEAVNMYLMFVKVFYDDIEYFMLKVCAIGYGVPLIIVAICLGIDVDNYANENYCFIPSGNVRNFGFILVIGVLILFNSVVFILVMRKLTCGRKIAKTIDQSKREIVIKRLQNAIAVSVLLGLTWAFGFLAIDSDSSVRDVFQTLFCIFNSLQGLFIFLLFCVRQKDIRDAWKGCCKESDRASRVKYATDTSNKKVKDQSIPLTHDSTQNSNTQSSNTKSNV
ncbi:adhesion G-protein coupled receptor G2-like [Anneissia japonica]|uniref:adhesion G-protein coupled receptor G2-like n=1 Tax=Anneissia japonica TaxID=1529436 RepID=UPI001425ACD6|nr:adhesion G-protein coupled receptor G2-like [Anneissia japonica]